MLTPFTPHMAEELWVRLGEEPSVFDEASWPEYDEDVLRTEEVEIPVQVDGTLRATIQVSRGADEDVVREAALAEENVRRHLEGREVTKVIHVPDRLLNLVSGG
jgi:leucyl-tRNA synthetase